MADYKLFASDLDGTLLDNDAELNAENAEAIKSIINAGGIFIPVTGRCFSEMPKALLEIEGIEYVINSNGASVYNLKTRACHITHIKPSALAEIIEVLFEYECLIAAHSNNENLVSSELLSEEAFDYYNINRLYKKVVMPPSIPTDNLNEALKEGSISAEMLSIFFRDKNKLIAAVEELQKINGISVTSSGGDVEVIDASVSKGATLKNVAAALRIPQSAIITSGDNHNDISLTLISGLSLAVANAVPALKAAADKTICSNTDNAAAYVYKNYFK